jgi:hypothetical protein
MSDPKAKDGVDGSNAGGVKKSAETTFPALVLNRLK